MANFTFNQLLQRALASSRILAGFAGKVERVNPDYIHELFLQARYDLGHANRRR